MTLLSGGLPKTTPFNFPPSVSALLRLCKSSAHLRQVHAHIVRRGFEQDTFVVTQFVCLCNSLRDLLYAAAISSGVRNPSVHLWNALVRGYCEHSSATETLRVFAQMMQSGTGPDKLTFPFLIKACSNECASREGEMVHCLSVRCGLDDDLFVRTGLIDFYVKCGGFDSARKVFDKMLEGDEDFGYAPSWNAMIGGYVRVGDLVNARKLFDQMPKRNVVSYTVLIDGYAKAGDMVSASFLFEQSPCVDIVAWSALISGHAQNGQENEAVKIFFKMLSRNVKPDEFILVSLMSACSRIRCFELAKWIDAYVWQSSIDHHRAHVMAALIDMNAKCGNMERAVQLFEMMPNRSVITYCSMMQGLSIHGRQEEAVTLFDRMLGEGLAPDTVAFIVVLTACSQAGLVEEGCYYFELMKSQYSVAPSPDHYACMVNLLGRSGRLRTAYELLSTMPVEPHAGAWGALLGACKLHSDVNIAEMVAGRLFKLEPRHAGNYALLSNIYASADRWLDVSVLQNEIEGQGLKKIPGRCWV